MVTGPWTRVVLAIPMDPEGSSREKYESKREREGEVKVRRRYLGRARKH